MTLPNFLVIGAMKAGTTSLWQYLRRHPGIFMPASKEPSYFAKHWDLGPDWYRSLFRDAGDAIAIGEASTDYTKYPVYRGVPERIRSLLPNVRLIYVIRNPIDRIRSHYVQELAAGRETRPAERAVLDNPDYVNFSRYSMQIEQFLSCFPQESLLIVISERLRDQRLHTMKKICGFLGVTPTRHGAVLSGEYHQAGGRRAPISLDRALHRVPGFHQVAKTLPDRLKRAVRTRLLLRPIDFSLAELSEEVTTELQDLLADDLHRLKAHVGKDFDAWRLIK
jgi:hypothetical protein